MTDVFNGLVPGIAANLVQGYAPGWDPANGVLDILNRPAEQPMTPQTPVLSGARGDWGYPVITLHTTADSLVTQLLGYAIDAPAIDTAPPSLPAGALLLSSPQGESARSRLAATLGVSLDKPGLRYALVQLIRPDETLHHTTKENRVLTTVHALQPDPRIGVDGEFMRAMARLRHFQATGTEETAGDLTQKDANAFLDTFAQWGTHFVSSVMVGDQIVQVFAYDAERFERVQAAFHGTENNFTGAGAVNFQYFTTDASKGAFGFVQEYGNILNLSNALPFRESLAGGEWTEKTWAKQNSVFQPFAIDTAVPLDRLNRDFTDQAPIGITLGPLTTFTEYKRTAVWRRVFKAAMSSVFGDAIHPNFTAQDTTDFAALIPEDQPGVVSAIATPHINIYKARLNLAGMQLVARSQVRNFVSYGYVVGGASAGTVELPGSRVCLYGYILDMRAVGRPNVVSLSDEGFDGLAIGCERFLGVARFQTRDGGKRFLVADGLRYDLDASGWPRVTDDIRRPPAVSDLPDLKDSLEFSLAFGEAVLGMQTGESEPMTVRTLARGYMKWVGQVIPAATDDEDLLAMRFRALDLGSYAPNSGYGAFVPILPASDYEASVRKILDYLQEIQRQVSENTLQINQRKQAELTIDVAKALNDNIVQSGQLLTGLIESNAQTAKDLSSHYDSVIAASQAEAKAQQDKINDLSKAVFEQQAQVNQAVQQYKAAVVQWETMEWIKFGLDVATTTFTLGTSILVPASSISAVKDLGLTAQRIQKALNTLNATMKVYTTISGTVKNMQDAQKTLDGLDGMDYGDTTALSWDEMSLQLDVVMSTGPSGSGVNEAKAEMVAAFKILVLRGKALTSAQSGLHQIQRDIYATQRQKVLNDRQAERLAALVGHLHPAHIQDLDKEAIDLVGLTGSLDYLRRQMLTTFAKSFLLQDQALQYAWLQTPTPISSYSLLTFMQSRIAQNEATLEAKSLLLQYQASTTKPITIDIQGVLATDISNGSAFEIVIDPNTPQLRQYVNLRVQAVVAEVMGVKATDGGKLLTRLTFESKPFVDRSVERTMLRFHTPWRERVYQFDVATGQPDFSDQGRSWSAGVSPVTPFGAWLVSLPKTQTNRGLVFDGMTVDIRLTFVLEARIVDVPMRAGARARAQRRAQDTETVRGTVMALAANGPEQPTPDGLIAQLNAAGTTTNGWDAVFNMGLPQINSALRGQYEALKHDTQYKNTISAQTKTKVVDGVWSIKKFYLEYGYPLLSFQANNNSTVMLTMAIEKGSLTNCILVEGTPEKCDAPVSMAGKTLTAVVNLSKVAGQITKDGRQLDILKVELHMAQGAFSVENIDISDEEKVALNAAIKAYFSENPVVYLINALDLTSVPVIEGLKPKGFLFKVLRTPASVDILQLFIQTGERPLLNPTLTFLNNVPEPLPQGNQASLLIRSDLFFSEILPNAMSKSGWNLAGRKSSEQNAASWGEFTNAPVAATNIDLSSLTQTTTSSSPMGGGGSSTTTRYFFPDNTVTWNLSGMTLKPLRNGQMQLQGSKTQSMTVNTRTSYAYWPCFSGCSRTWDGSFTNDATSNVQAAAPVDVSGSGRDQSIRIAMQSQAVTVTGHVAGGGPSGSDNLQAKVNQQVKSQVPQQITSQLNVSFSAVSLFAIKNLLFPANNYINFTRAAVPGDLLVLGNFQA